jgi:hypothetical protein
MVSMRTFKKAFSSKLAEVSSDRENIFAEAKVSEVVAVAEANPVASMGFGTTK